MSNRKLYVGLVVGGVSATALNFLAAGVFPDQWGGGRGGANIGAGGLLLCSYAATFLGLLLLLFDKNGR